MKKFILLLTILIGLFSNAQTFISRAKIEFEVKTNQHKAMGEGIWADMAKDNIPQFSLTYYDYLFADNKSIYRFNRFDPKSKVPWANEENEAVNIWYNDYAKGMFANLKEIGGENYLLKDSLTKLEWRFINESRNIAGFLCRKAVTKIFDSVYVFAFYTDEITISGGPQSLHGLPGMILGVTIPRMYTSWIATKVELTFDEKKIVSPTKGTVKTVNDIKKTILNVTKDWRGSWVHPFIWNSLL
jgi:GLPGLI family protein